MKKLSCLITLVFICLLSACAPAAVPGSAFPDGHVIEGENRMMLTKIGSRTWVHTSWYEYEGTPTPSNGLLIATDEGFVLVDTPWTDEQTEMLIGLVEDQFEKKIVLAVITHAHIDRIGGVAALNKLNIRTISTGMTAELAEKGGYAKPEAAISEDVQLLSVKGVTIEICYPGTGHSPDNITVWAPDDKVLFGGCLVKPMDAKGMGNTADADTDHWPEAIKAVKQRYPDAVVVVPGHGAWGGPELIDHTLELLDQLN